eukprot:753828-Pyramimonas_sp.AAC.1
MIILIAQPIIAHPPPRSPSSRSSPPHPPCPFSSSPLVSSLFVLALPRERASKRASASGRAEVRLLAEPM